MTGPERWALGLLVLGPVLVLPGALNRFVFVKVAAVMVGAALAAATCRPRGRLPRPARYGLGVGAVLLLAGALTGAAPLAQMIGRGPRYEGLVVLPVYLAAGVCGARLLGPGRGPGSAVWLIRLLAVAAAAVGVLALLEAAGLRPLSSNVARPGSLLGNASDEGAFAILLLGPLAAVGVATRNRWALVGAGLATVTVAVSESRGALLATVVTVGLLVWLLERRTDRLVVVGALVAVAVLALALPTTRSRTLGASRLAGQTVGGRLMLWRETLSLVADHPLLGVGPSGFEDAIVRYHTLTWERRIGPANPVDSPHDWILQAAASGGLPLALLALVLVGYMGWRGLGAARAERAGRAPPLMVGLLAGVAGYGLALLVHLTAPGPTSLAALYGGALIADPPTTALTRAWRRWATVGCAAALALLLLLAGIAEIPLRSAVLALSHGDTHAAEDDFSAAHDLRPWDLEVNLVAGHAYAVLALNGALTAALGSHWLGPVRSRVPDSVQVLEDLAALRASAGDLASAGRLLDQALRWDRFDPQLLLRRGVVYAEQKRYPQAVQILLAVTRIAPRSPDPWLDLAIVYRAEHLPAAGQRAAAEAAALQREAAGR